MSKKTPHIHYEWRPDISGAMRVYWSLKGANGEIQCHSSQGSRDMTDARRSVMQAAGNMTGLNADGTLRLREKIASKRPPSLAKYQAKKAAEATIAANAVEDAKLFGVKPAAMTANEKQQADGNGV